MKKKETNANKSQSSPNELSCTSQNSTSKPIFNNCNIGNPLSSSTICVPQDQPKSSIRTNGQVSPLSVMQQQQSQQPTLTTPDASVFMVLEYNDDIGHIDVDAFEREFDSTDFERVTEEL